MDWKNVLQNRYLIFAAVVIPFVLVLAFASPRTVDITGTLSLSDSNLDFQEGEVCYGSGGYDDIDAGTQVTVMDGENKIIAVSELGDGKMEDGFTCDFSYTVYDVPKTDIYQIEIANRGKLKYSNEQLKERNFIVDSTLGD